MVVALTNVTEIVERHTQAMLADIRRLGLTAVIAEPAAFGSPTVSETTASVWTEIKRLDGQRYSWPPDAGGEEEYDPFIVHQSGNLALALAYNKEKVIVKDKWRKQIWVFHMGAGLGSKEPVSPFIEADDYEQTREMVSIIRGNGDTGRKMFDLTDQLPPEYAALKTEILGDRVAGHYNKLCVVAHEDDTESMLRHGAAQARLRRF